MKPVQLEVITPLLEGMGICSSCELVMGQAGMGEHPAERALEEYPQEWQEDQRRLLDLIFDLANRYQDQIAIKVLDPRSVAGLYKSLRHGVRRYPTWIVNGKKRVVGWDREALEAALGQ